MRHIDKRMVFAAAIGFVSCGIVAPLAAQEGSKLPVDSAHAEESPPARPPLTAPIEDTGPALSVRHTPIAVATENEPLRVAVVVRAAHRFSELLLRYRRRGDGDYQSARFARVQLSDYAADIPAAETGPGVVEYYIASRGAGSGAASAETLHFASPASPHEVIIAGDDEARWRKELLAFHLGSHSRFQFRSEYVDFGSRAVADTNTHTLGNVRDYYWRLEADYTYRILSWIYSIRIGGGYLSGSAFQHDNPNPNKPITEVDPNNGYLYVSAGLIYGFTDIRFRLGRLVRVDVRGTLGGGPGGFVGGAGGQFLIGYDPGVHLAIGFDYISDIGKRGWLRLAWDTIPYFPMWFAVEITTMPNSNDQVSGRALLGIEHRFNRYFSVNAFGGYNARDITVGGPSVGLGATLEF